MLTERIIVVLRILLHSDKKKTLTKADLQTKLRNTPLSKIKCQFLKHHIVCNLLQQICIF